MMTENCDRDLHSPFPIQSISKIAEKESWRKEVNRPIYHIHKWWAQRLGSIFRGILLYLMCDQNCDTWSEFYNKHDFSEYTILDPFMGSGTTIGEAIKLGANAIGCDINPISTYMVQQELTRIPLVSLYAAYRGLEASVSEDILRYYKTKNPDTGNEIPVLYYFWVKLVKTPSGERVPLFSSYVFAKNAYPSKKPAAQILCPRCWNVFSGRYDDDNATCPRCGHIFNPQTGPASNTTITDSVGHVYRIKELVPDDELLEEEMYALLAIDEVGEKKYLPICDYDLQLYQQAQNALEREDGLDIPYYEVRPGYNTDQARGYNYLHWKDFFNARQLLCLRKLLKGITEIKDREIREQLLCLFSSTLEFNNTFCSYKGEGTGAVRPIFSNHILKPERTPLENSVWGYSASSGGFSNLFQTRLLKAKEYLDKPFELQIDDTTGTCEKIIASKPMNPKLCTSWIDFCGRKGAALILNGDSSMLSIPDASVDFVVTDPPYFDFIHYSELSDFFYAWLSPVLKDDYTFFAPDSSGRNNEVQQKEPSEFSRLLGNVFSECNRVLKSEGKLAFSFHHSRVDGWIAVAKAIKEGGFCIDESFPVHAELMASTPKASAKEPISLDAIIICSKRKKQYNKKYVIAKAFELATELINAGKQLSKADIFVISSSQCLHLLCSGEYTLDEEVALLREIYNLVLDRVSVYL